MKFNVRAYALTFGLWWGGGLFLLAWWMIAVGDTTGAPTLLERAYLGYRFTPLGSIVGLVWGFVDGLVSGAVFAWLYNLLGERLFAAKPEA